MLASEVNASRIDWRQDVQREREMVRCILCFGWPCNRTFGDFVWTEAVLEQEESEVRVRQVFVQECWNKSTMHFWRKKF